MTIRCNQKTPVQHYEAPWSLCRALDQSWCISCDGIQTEVAFLCELESLTFLEFERVSSFHIKAPHRFGP